MGIVNIVFIVLSVFVLTTSVFMVQRGTKDFKARDVESPEVLSEMTDYTPIPMPTPMPWFTPEPTQDPTPKPIPVTPKPSQAPNTSAQLSGFIYPGSIVTSQSQDQIKLSSTDMPNTIMGWYNNKLNSMNMSNRKADVKNNVNNGGDSFSAILTGSNEDLSIRIEIKKSGSDSVASITVELD